MSTLGNAADFGDLTNNGNGGGASNSIRGLFVLDRWSKC